ncbi:LPXTG cell wall anchor domain-containing protein [Streptomyces sp. SP17BM10]|uniref:lytic polysaccharide monooxygenase n=1 Tax=Streptomyces sp. SP17BM10 TaxID=3002530 RepID=UPI002E76B7DE|nr:lytic polysaccharide monooxygenase [Streptomyces sp. SP17BM10]MEE1782190.1 LPXTG cell wall anchor domain-containing protein [Streptomyces sp. SP17BM10]
MIARTQLIYVIWQRSDSPEAFYACSDVVFDGTGTTPPATTAASTVHPAAHDHPAIPTPTATAPRVPAATAVPHEHAAPSTPAAAAPPDVLRTPSAPDTAPPAGTAQVPAPDQTQLAHTGSDRPVGPIGAIGLSLLFVGATALAVKRRRRNQVAHSR